MCGALRRFGILLPNRWPTVYFWSLVRLCYSSSSASTATWGMIRSNHAGIHQLARPR